MAILDNPRKQFNFRLIIEGFAAVDFYAQRVQLPDSELEVVEHGAGNHKKKTAGQRSFGTMTVEKLLTTQVGHLDNQIIWDWHNRIQSVTSGGIPASIYYKSIDVYELAEDGLQIINKWAILNAWPSKVSGQEFNRMSSDNTIESVEFTVEDVRKVL